MSRRELAIARLARLALWLPLALAAIVAVAAVGLPWAGVSSAPPSEALGSLVGRALMGAAGKMDAGELIAAYPPNSLLPLVVTQLVPGISGFEAAGLLSAVLAAALAGLWLRGLLRAGFRPVAATAITLLLCANPLFLRAVAEGPELMITILGAWAFAISAFAVRGRAGVNDLMLCSASLILLAFGGQAGALLVIATLPFLLLIMPPDIRMRSRGSVYLVLLFPVLFCLLGFMLINWMMLHDPLAFLRAQIEASGEWFAGSWRHAAAEIVSAATAASVLIGQFILARGRRPVQSVAVALLGSAMLMGLLSMQTGLGLSLTVALAPIVGFSAAAAMRWPVQQHRALRLVTLLGLSLLGAGSALVAERYGHRSGSAIDGDHRIAADRRFGMFLAGHSDVLIDASAHPQVVAARGSAAGLVTASDTAFDLAMLRKRVAGAATAVAVAAPDPSHNADTLGRILPNLYARGEPGFHLIYDRDGWRVWSRQPQKGETPWP